MTETEPSKLKRCESMASPARVKPMLTEHTVTHDSTSVDIGPILESEYGPTGVQERFVKTSSIIS